MRQISRRLSLSALSVLLLVCAASPAHAQYFGRNKVQYKDFKFEVLKTEHFDVYFYDEESENAARVGQMAERWYARLSKVFEHEIRTRQPLVLYASHPDFEQTNAIGGMLGEGTGGVTEGLKRRVVLPLGGTLAETDHVLGHELVHAFQYDISAQRPAGGGIGAGIERLPLWFVEGLAEYLSIGPVDPHTAMWLRDATRKEELPQIRSLDSGEFFPYRWGQAVWAYIGGKYGDDLIGQIFRSAVRDGDAIEAIKQATLIEDKELSANWHAAIREQYSPVMQATARAHTFGRPLSANDTAKRTIDVSPSISPDGRHIVYFSARDVFSIDLYLADVATGKIVRKLVDTALNSHFTSLQFIGSAGSWSPNSRQFVVGGVRAGKAGAGHPRMSRAATSCVKSKCPRPARFSTRHGRPTTRPLRFRRPSAATRISSFSTWPAERAGVSRTICSPTCSPHGRPMAIASCSSTDRFTTDVKLLRAGDYRLALYDVATGNITPLSTFAEGKNINPQWSSDNRRVFFVSDRNGISNVYAVDTSSGAITQVTDMDSGVSGITALSPAISSAMDAKTLALSAYEEGSHHIYLIEADRLAGTPVVSNVERLQASTLPPAPRESMVATLLSDATTGLATTPAEVQPYKSTLKLDTVSQPYISAGIDRFGGSIGGGIAFQFSDMLGNHNLYAQVNADTYGAGASELLKNTGAALFYTNTAKRWNWGVGVEQSPYLAGGTQPRRAW